MFQRKYRLLFRVEEQAKQKNSIKQAANVLPWLILQPDDGGGMFPRIFYYCYCYYCHCHHCQNNNNNNILLSTLLR
jgi:hypothetical protein